MEFDILSLTWGAENFFLLPVFLISENIEASEMAQWVKELAAESDWV